MAPPTAAEVKEKALALLARLDGIREAGGGTIPVEELLELVGVPADPQLQRDLAARGDLEVTFSDGAGGSFRNVGPAFTAEVGPLKLHVPAELSGQVAHKDHAATFHFNPRHSVTGKMLFIEVHVNCLEVSDHHVAVRVPGGLLDQEYRF